MPIERGNIPLRNKKRAIIAAAMLDYILAHYGFDRTEDRYYDCGPELGILRMYVPDDWFSAGSWLAEWITVEECPIDLDKLPK